MPRIIIQALPPGGERADITLSERVAAANLNARRSRRGTRDARIRTPARPWRRTRQGEIQSLPFPDDTFDAVTGFNSFQYAADPVVALREAMRVTAPGGRILALVWSPAEMCELAPHLQSLGALMPPPPLGTPGPFALCGRDALEEFFATAGLEVAEVEDVMCVFAYPDTATAITALSSAGPVVGVAEYAGTEAVRLDIEAFLARHVRPDGTYAIPNPFRYAVSTPIA